jgi:hypothetical protein
MPAVSAKSPRMAVAKAIWPNNNGQYDHDNGQANAWPLS